MTHSIRVLGALAVSVAISAVSTGGAAGRAEPAISVFKTATCGCCAKWVDHLKAHGFAPTVTNVENVTPVKTKHNVPRAVHSCHTALVEGYVIEGHVPASDIKRLLKERPAVAGIGVGGMPAGSPGMESATPERYDVLSFDKQGRTTVFSTHGAK